jgi:hypothetical protein
LRKEKDVSPSKQRGGGDSATGAGSASAASTKPPKTILRKLSIRPDEYHITSPGSSKHEACIFFPKAPRAWFGANGLIVVPNLSEKGLKGSYEIDFICSEKVFVNQLPDSFSRTIAGEWTESTAGGSHLCSTWLKNPRYLLKFRHPVDTDEPVRVRISLARVGVEWKPMVKKDTVGCMIGFYIFIVKEHEQTKLFESIFVPDNELATEPTFTLEQLPSSERYAIVPTTMSEGKIGQYVLSVLSEHEFSMTKEG